MEVIINKYFIRVKKVLVHQNLLIINFDEIGVFFETNRRKNIMHN